MMFKISPSIFKGNEICGESRTLTAPAAKLIGRALAAGACAEGHISLGWDEKRRSATLAKALASGLNYGGLRVLNRGIALAPIFNLATKYSSKGNGVMIAGGHAPKTYSIKITVQGKTLESENLAALCSRINENNYDDDVVAAPLSPEAATIDEWDYINEICKRIALPFGNAGPPKIILEADDERICRFAPKLYRALGCWVHDMNYMADGNTPNRRFASALSENQKNEARKKEMEKRCADSTLIFGENGDCLSVLLPDESGEPQKICPGRLLMLFARYMLRAECGYRVVFEGEHSPIIAPFVQERGDEPVPVESGFIQSQMQRTGALLGGDMNGRFYFLDWHGSADAFFAGAFLLRILAEGGGMRGIPEMTSPAGAEKPKNQL